jgi:ParB/RepB/Spo0J family partition protein
MPPPAAVTDHNAHALVRRSLEENQPARSARVSLNRIRLHPTHYRHLGDLRELAENIRIEGLHQPITVQQRGDHFEVVDGRRRFGAAQLAGLRKVPVFIQPARSDAEVISAMVATDVHKRLMTAAEKAHAVRLMRAEGFTVKAIAARWGVTESAVYGWLSGAPETKPRRRSAAGCSTTSVRPARRATVVSVKKLSEFVEQWRDHPGAGQMLDQLRQLAGIDARP